ncbi:MAG: TIGR04211 family SH3 domain-containing protein [Gammaproteobacteria bacterium]
MIRALTLLMMAFVFASATAQETAYVTDMVQLGLHHEQDTSGDAFENLVSGTELTVLERVPNYARVRTADGQEGWVRSFYLVDEKPARLRLAEAEAEIARLEQALATIQAESSESTDEAETLIARAERELAAAAAAQASLEQLERENQTYAERMELYRGALPWPWIAAALVVALAGGFLAGWWWLDASIRRRYGGFRMY